MITKKDLMLRIIDLELQLAEQEQMIVNEITKEIK